MSWYTNYFDRPSAPEPTNADEEFLAKPILEEAKELKHFADDNLHPEVHVVMTDPLACFTNYFDRPLAPSPTNADEVEEFERILEEAKQLKRLAVNYLHPELRIVTTDPTACGRNFFDCPSAPGHTDMIHSLGHKDSKQSWPRILSSNHTTNISKWMLNSSSNRPRS